MSLPGDTPLTPDIQCDLFFPLPEELPHDQHLLKWLDVLGFNKDHEGVVIRRLEMAQPVK